MPHTPAARPAAEPSVLRQRLAALRRRMRRTAILRGVSWLVLFTVLLAVSAGLLDALRPQHSLVRATVLVAWLGGVGLLSWRYLYQPLSQRCDDLSLALRVEQRFPALNDALASTVQFLDAPAGEGGESAALRREAVKRTLDRAKAYDFNRVVDARRLRTLVAGAAFAGAAAVALVLIFPGAAFSALGRLLNPFNNRELPPQSLVTLIPDPPPSRVSKGESYEIHGQVAGVLPPNARAKLIVRMDGSSTREDSTDVAPDGDKKAKFSFRLPNVDGSFHFRVRYNDAESKEYAVKVLPPPDFARQGKWPQVVLYPPPYTGLPSPQAQTPGQGDVDAVLGTRVVLRAAVDRPVRAAWIDYPAVPGVAAFGLGAAGAQASARIRAPAVLDDGRTAFTISFTPSQSGRYVLHFEDDTGLAATQPPFDLTINPDEAPKVSLDRPAKTSDVLTFLPTAALPLQVGATDDYGLRSVRLEYRFQADGSPAQRLMLHDPATAAAEVLAPLMGAAVEAVPPPQRPTQLEFHRNLPVAALRGPNGAAPQAGDVIVLQAVADDWDDVSPAKEPGRSDTVEVRIVSPNEFNQVAIPQEEHDLQMELVQLREKELAALQAAEAAEDKLKQVEKIQPKEGDQSDEAKKQRLEAAKLQKEAEDELADALRLQRGIKDGVGDADSGARARVARLLESLKANGKPANEPVQDRLERMRQELARIAADQLPPIEPKLAQGMKEAELLDPKNKAEFQKLKEAQAADFDKQATEAEQDAERLDSRAKANSDAAEKERLHQEAEQARGRALALRAEAAQERQEAKAETPAAGLQAKTARAEAAQQQVEKTLNDLITYSSTREAKVEAGRILEEQRKLAAEAAELEKQQLGKDMKDLTQAQRAALDQLRDSQKRLAERTQQMLNQMNRTVEAQKELEKLARDQDDLQQKIQKAQTPRELEPLAQKQKDLADQTKAEAAELKRLGAGQAATALKQAADAMDRNAEALNKGKKPENADAASKALQEAQKEKDPSGADELKDVLDKMQPNPKDSDDAGLAGAMKKAGEELQKNQLGEAKKDQEKAANKLQAMLERMDAREHQQREDDQDQLAKKLDAAQQELQKLAKDVDELQKKIQATDDPKELQQLAKKEKELVRQAKDAADELQRLGVEQGAAAARQAADALDQNAERLEKGDKPKDAGLALDRLQEAQDEADDAKLDAQDQLEREKQARIADEVKGIKERQEGLNQEAERLRDALAQKMLPDDMKRGMMISVGDLRDSQNGLADDTKALAKKDLADAPVLLRLMTQASESMTAAGARLDEGVKAKPAEVGDAAIQAQREASRRLSLVLDALQSQDQVLPEPADAQGGKPPGPNGDPATQPDGVPPLAQLKALRAMQKAVNDRTGAFHKDHPEEAKFGDKEKAEADDIHKQQQDVIALMEEFRRPTPPKKDDDKK